MLSRLGSKLNDYTSTRSFGWYWYAPFWLFGLYLFVKLLDFELGGQANSFFVLVMQSVNFFLHEMAHLFAAFLPDLLTAAAGSGSELLLGLGLIIGGFLGKTYFASLFGFLWFMLAAHATADYMADARSQSMPLVSFGGGDPIHDWNFIFGKLGLLEQDTLIAGMMRWSGTLAGLFGLGFSAWLIIGMMQAKRRAAHKARMDEIMNKTLDRTPADRPDKPFLGGDLYPAAKTGPLADRQQSGDKDPGPKASP